MPFKVMARVRSSRGTSSAGDDRLPRGRIQRRADAEHEAEPQHRPLGGHVKESEDAERARRQQHPDLVNYLLFAPIDDIGQCAGGQRQKEYRQTRRGMDERDHQR